ncbi:MULTISPECIES: helix-turn-helix domain-containing protein [unclassified Caballeronia]|uniref:helix-turn-helix domain-containing protein n=1 Tax=unclassified Caballeronia TaxID=2646786 RepID=UPI002863A2C6|nr:MULTISPECIES: helix-turn-helix domain-containing protein [unclassified Caballeronia]MDR5777592.1 helix-turn-helix domain-containing protein [Caballeronia sp. LZ002]MDR5802348.1 helix-turn-helix domain-containing protein [Caballeronia sp. LZ001]MDR5853034.1 helix-turn-helix domain-containing protein [Caballeronia sp. LZ003]
MSIKVQTMVWDRYPGEDHELLLALKLADYCDDNGEHIFPSIETLAQKTRRSARAVQYQIKSMVQRGWLVQVANAGGGRGKTCEYRISPGWINGAEIAPLVGPKKGATVASFSKGAKDAPNAKGAMSGKKGATNDVKGATNDSKGCNGLHPIHQEPSEPSENHQPARRASRVASHEQIRNLELPDEIPSAVWAMWCEHREAKHKDAPWTRVAAAVSVKRLLALAAGGQSPEVTVEEAVLRGWTGLFPVRAETLTQASPGGARTIAADWWRTSGGIEARAEQLGVRQGDGELFMRFKARVFKAAGPGEWMEDMLRTVGRESEERYEALYAYFNDIPRDRNGNTEAA